MGNESSKKGGTGDGPSSTKHSIISSLKKGPSSSVVQRHLENARKSRVLQLKESNIKEIPPALQEVADVIRNLDLSQNKIHDLPSYIGEFKVLKHLHLSNNALSILPDEIGCLKSLEVLNISSNRLSSLPPTLVGCNSLKTLNISNNNFVQFPTVVCHLLRLETADLSKNSIESLPDEITDLQATELNLNQNRLSTLNPNLYKCKRLKILRIQENCLPKTEFTRELLENSQISLISFEGNLFQEKEFQELYGYEEYQKRYTATRLKGVY